MSGTVLSLIDVSWLRVECVDYTTDEQFPARFSHENTLLVTFVVVVFHGVPFCRPQLGLCVNVDIAIRVHLSQGFQICRLPHLMTKGTLNYHRN